MIIERIVYCAVCLILFSYIVKKYLNSKGGIYLSLLAIQLVCMITQLIAFFSKIYVDIFMQLYILIFNILIPAGIFIAEYLNINFEEFLEIKLGDFYAKRVNYDKAIEKYKKAVSKNSNNAQTFAKLGRIYNAKGDRRTAFDRFARAIEINRNDYRSYYEIGVIFNDMGKQADAQIVLDNALRIKPDFTPASELLAVVLSAQNKYDEAINVYKNATRYDPDNYQLYYRMGVVRTELRDFNEAKECYERAIQLNPSLYQAYFSLGQINLLKGELEQAEKMFKKSLVSKDLTAKAYYQLAKVYILNDEEIKAVTYLSYAIDIDSSYKYKAESEPLFAKIKDYITGLSMANKVMQQAENIGTLKKIERQREEAINENSIHKPMLELEEDDDFDIKKETPRDKLAAETRKIISKENINNSTLEKNPKNEKAEKEINEPKENKFLKVMKSVLGFNTVDGYEEDSEHIAEQNNVDENVEKSGKEAVQETVQETDRKKEILEKYNIKEKYFSKETKINDVSDNTSKKEDTDDDASRQYTKHYEEYYNTVTKKDNKSDYIYEVQNDEIVNKKSTEFSDDSDKLDIFEKFKRLKKAEDEKAERLRREQKIRQLEELKNQENTQLHSEINQNTNDDYENEEPVVVRTIGRNESEEARKEIQRLMELRKTRNFEIENNEIIETQKEEKTSENGDEIKENANNVEVYNTINLNKTKSYEEESNANENFEDEDTMDEPHFDFMDRFKRK